MKKIFILTTQTEHFAKPLINKNHEVILPEKNRERKRFFPDGEVYSRIPSAEKLKCREVIVLHSGCPEPNSGLVELELILQILKEAGCKIEIFFTYFPYGMQDCVFEKGETNSSENLLKKFVDYYSVKKIYIIDPHFGKREWVKKYPIKQISASPLLIKKAIKEMGENILLASPDKGSERRAGICGMNKKRLDSFTVEMENPGINFKDRTIGVVDDIVKTGGTLVKFSEIAKKSGAKKVVALITHGVILEGIKRVKKKFSKLYLTNTINREEANIDVTDLIIENI